MEPRTHARGNSFGVGFDTIRSIRFNGATHSRAWKLCSLDFSNKMIRRLQWSHALTRVETAARLRSLGDYRGCFNGATHSRAWKRRCIRWASLISSELQWSHALTRVETSQTGTTPPHLVMSFNGATHSRAWKLLWSQTQQRLSLQ